MFTSLKDRLGAFIKSLKEFFTGERRWSSFGILLALLLALPAMVWGFSTMRFETRKRAATGEITPTPLPTILPTPTPFLTPGCQKSCQDIRDCPKGLNCFGAGKWSPDEGPKLGKCVNPRCPEEISCLCPTPTPKVTPTPTRIPTPTPTLIPTPTPVLNFPADHGSHPSFNAEWWYLNLLTRTTKADGTDQRDLAYVLSFSRILGSNNLLSSRYDNTSKSFKESTEQAGSLVVQLMDGSRLFVQFSKGLVLTTLEELATGSDRKKVYHLTGRTANMGSFDLTLKEKTVVFSGFNTPLLWGGTTGNCQGKISVFAQDDTYYYSVPDLDITGSITDLDGTRRNILIGKAWIDHQWFNSSPPSDWRGHYWTNFHFTNSSDLYSPGPHQAFGFVTQIYSSGSRYTYWVKRNANGTNECGTNGTVVVKSYGSANYPNSWTVNNGSLGANGYSFSDNQIFQPPIGPKFIEAASYYSGNLNGIPFTGLGFFETHLIRPSATPIPTPTPTPLRWWRLKLPRFSF